MEGLREGPESWRAVESEKQNISADSRPLDTGRAAGSLTGEEKAVPGVPPAKTAETDYFATRSTEAPVLPITSQEIDQPPALEELEARLGDLMESNE